MPTSLTRRSTELIGFATRLAGSRGFDEADGASDVFPARDLAYLAQNGLLDAALPVELGGAGMGCEAGSHLDLLLLLKEIGRANLALGRIYEGHVNAIQLICAYGNPDQQAAAAADCLAGKLFGVWNTDAADGVRLSADGDHSWRLSGSKAFASGARQVDRPLVMAEAPEGRVMCVLKREEASMEISAASWRPLGMQASESCPVNLTGTRLNQSAVIGNAGDYYAAPLFLGGAIRTSAVLLGGAEVLFQYLRAYLQRFRQTQRPLQQLRTARIYAAVESGRGWLQYAAREAERGLYAHAGEAVSERMNFAANATRVAMEDLCPQVIRLVSEGVGARGLLEPFRFGGIIRDLTMFLRQPNPDDCLLDTGRYLLDSGDRNV